MNKSSFTRLNWTEGLKRVSALLWVCVAIFSVGYTVLGAIFDQELIILFMLIPAVVCPFYLHKITVFTSRWLADGFATK